MATTARGWSFATTERTELRVTLGASLGVLSAHGTLPS
jgi:hypothetical protein